MPHDPNDLMIWVDLEMTGLDPVADMILEVGFRITDWSGHEEHARFTQTVFNPGWFERLSLGDNRPAFEMHTANGLIAELQAAESEANMSTPWDVEGVVLDWLTDNGVPTGEPLAGSSNSLDRMFLVRWMPQVAQHFTYRVRDVSALREFMRVTTPGLFDRLTAEFAGRTTQHRPQADIDDTIELYQWIVDNYLYH